eukprot:SM000073S21427  [mRNA]  locus=s73:184139:185774:- [translate_table: standard]
MGSSASLLAPGRASASAAAAAAAASSDEAAATAPNAAAAAHATPAVPEESRGILSFWFGDWAAREPGSQTVAAEETARNAGKWFGGGEEVDAHCRVHYTGLLARAAAGGLAAWEATPRGGLALVLLLDQFSRNIYRNDARAFAQAEPAAAAVCSHRAITRGFPEQLELVQRVFFYMPLEHSEDLADQDECVSRFAQLVEAAPPELRDVMATNLRYAEAHRRVIQRFGRFPHRSATLGRELTTEEEQFLNTEGMGF